VFNSRAISKPLLRAEVRSDDYFSNSFKTRKEQKCQSRPKGDWTQNPRIRGFDCNQRDFGKLLGIGQTQLSKYEKGQSVPTLELPLRLKAHSGRSLDWIVTGEEEHDSSNSRSDRR
jgi:transcriptional regulator with XRE-family HTH domain